MELYLAKAQHPELDELDGWSSTSLEDEALCFIISSSFVVPQLHIAAGFSPCRRDIEVISTLYLRSKQS